MDWNQRYISEDTPWDRDAPAPALAFLPEQFPDLFKPNSKALVPGCGRGHDAAFIHELGVHTTGLDVSEQALELAAELYSEPHWELADIFNLPAKHHGNYHLIWEHTCFCAIPPSTRADYVASMHRCLTEGGHLTGIFFLDTEVPLEEGPPFSTSLKEIKALFSLHFDLIHESPPPATFEERGGKEWFMVWKKR